MCRLFRVVTDILNSVIYFYAGAFLVVQHVADFGKEVSNYFLLWLLVNLLR